jgi:hypothetical protein
LQKEEENIESSGFITTSILWDPNQKNGSGG